MILAFVFSLLCALILTPLIGKFANRIRALDHPDGRKIHQRPIPLLGGVAVFISFSAALALKPGLFFALKGLLPGAAALLIIGIIDDLRGLSAEFRLAVQVLAASFLFWDGVRFSLFPGHGIGHAGDYLLTVLWIVGITNAINCLDGLDGLAAGLGIILSAFLFLFSFETGDRTVYLPCLVLAGSLP